MRIAEFLDELGYRKSPYFLSRNRKALSTAPDFGHVFRLAKASLGLQGVYTLQPSTTSPVSVVPTVYVCRAESESRAEEIHRLVWNQDVVPFVIVHTPAGVRLYSGFRHTRSTDGGTAGILEPLTDFDDLSTLIEDFHAESINSGRLWENRAKDVTPQNRVDWKLLDNLRTLDGILRDDGLSREVSHALIGKYVYLHYLRDRSILSQKKLDRWRIKKESVFGRNATVGGLKNVVHRLDDWLNGGVFPLKFGGKNAPKQDHVRQVAAVFSGDVLSEGGDRQLSLDFEAYNFSYIPIETLSVVYEQFLHLPDDGKKTTPGQDSCAYYTPIPVVNLMLAELEERKPFNRGMRVFDPSCGSGAFLVQCYRRLIEKEFPPGTQPKPRQLRELLQESVFGIDVEADACNVTELSLTLTLLDYVDPPDLEGRGQSQFKLPALRNKNIVEGNFFCDADVARLPLERGFDWIIGNPPWKKLNPKNLKKHEPPVWDWMQVNEKQRPVGGYQAARAFAWRVLDLLSSKGEAGMFLPAMTLFENPAKTYRSEFFQQTRVNTVVNFSNLAEILSGKRFRVPSAAFFYQLRSEGEPSPTDGEFVRTFSPLVANQEPTRRKATGQLNESWSIVINASEIRDIPTGRLIGGDALPWKLATWGSTLDLRLLRKLERRFPSVRDLARRGDLVLSEGLQLRSAPSGTSDETVERVVGIRERNTLDMKQLRKLRHVFAVPVPAVCQIDPKLQYARKGRGELPLSVCHPPHIIVSAARNFAIYTDKYLVVPPRQIGITSRSNDEQFLKALSLYLSSDFAFYHQFLTSTQFGVQRGRATLNALRRMPIAIADLTKRQLQRWVDLHSQLAQTSPRSLKDDGGTGTNETRQLSLLPEEDTSETQNRLLTELNELVEDSLHLDGAESAMIRDLVEVRLALNDGKTGSAAVRVPRKNEIESYAKRLQAELDDFVAGELPKRHNVSVVHDEHSGMIVIDFVPAQKAKPRVFVLKADQPTAKQLEKTRRRLREQRAQWVYFDRNLRIYEGRKTFVFKPMQRFHWTESQAMIDAREIIAETLQGGGTQRD